jgi:site-specific DNA-methyltransferase (adenine-specific)
MKQNSEQKVEDMNVSPTCGKPLVMGSTVFNEDCMTVMARYPDKFFDLAIVDPPYGMIKNTYGSGSKGIKANFDCHKHNHREWDIKPSIQYTKELQRVSKNQIIWGANHFISIVPFDSSCWLVWDKDNTGDFADCELAWTSFNTAVRKFTWRWNGMLQQNMKQKEERIHPTQKPVALYDWIFQQYAKQGNLILDTHLGSGSSRIAAHKHNLEFVGCEIDAEYFAAQEARFKEFTSQLRMF